MSYIVRSGDNLHTIARKKGTTVRNLLRRNPQLRFRPDLIYPGERIRV